MDEENVSLEAEDSMETVEEEKSLEAMEEETIDEEVDEIAVSELADGDDVFLSTGKSKVKVTKGGKVRALVFKIKSSGVADLVDQFNKKAPTPPVHKEIVTPESDIGKQMGVRKKQWVKMPDYADPGYIEALAKHNEKLGMAILLQGLDVSFKNKAGNIVTDADEKIEIMQKQNMTGSQFMQIVRDIQDLTRWNEEATEDFFVEG